MLSYKESLKILKEANALLEGHFILSSGLHSKQYVQCAKLLSHPKKAEAICSSLCEKINKSLKNIDIILSPLILAPSDVTILAFPVAIIFVKSDICKINNNKSTLAPKLMFFFA